MTAIETGRRTDEASPRIAAAHWRTTCLNCGATLAGSYCGECGQHAAPPHPTLRELGGEAFAELSGWDGKVAETVRALIRKPGKLTVEFLAGRRASYLSPLRLYLTCSVIYFLIAAWVPSSARSSIVVTPGASVGAKASPINIVDLDKQGGLTDEDRQQIARTIEKAPPLIKPVMRRVSTDARGFQTDMLAALPKALFALLPVFAAILALFYRRRHFAEHLYFALHLHAFIFIAIAFAKLSRLSNAAGIQMAVGVAILIWVLGYTHAAFRRVYGGSFAVTALKEVGIGALYLTASIPALFFLALWVGR